MSRGFKIFLILLSIPLLFAVGVTIVLAAPTVGTGLTFDSISISVHEKTPGGVHLTMPVPTVFVDAALRTALATGALDDQEPLPPEAVRALPHLRDVARLLADTPEDFTLVEVRDRHDHVRIDKVGDRLQIMVRSTDADVDVDVPIALVPRILELLERA